VTAPARIRKRFAELRAGGGELGIVAYIVAGDPTLDLDFPTARGQSGNPERFGLVTHFGDFAVKQDLRGPRKNFGTNACDICSPAIPQKESPVKVTPHLRNWSIVMVLFASFLTAQTESKPQGDVAQVPDAAMMVPVTALAQYMAHVQGKTMPSVFAKDGLVILENFAPYIYVGKDAATRWDAGYRRHIAPVKDLKFNFGTAHDFERTGDRVYFVLPTTWVGWQPGGRFEEHGAWSFVLENSSGQWRILAYGWGATDEQDWPTKTQ
jgi:hypothetical protein